MSRQSQRQRNPSKHAPSTYLSNSSNPFTDVGKEIDPSYQPYAIAPSSVSPLGNNSGGTANLQDQLNRNNAKRQTLNPRQSQPAPARATVAQGSFNPNTPAAQLAENPSGYARPAGLSWPQTLEEVEANLASAFSGWNPEIPTSGYQSTAVGDNVYQPVVGWSPYDGYIVAGQWVPDRARLNGPGQDQGQELEPVGSTTTTTTTTTTTPPPPPPPVLASKSKTKKYTFRNRNRDAVADAVPAEGKKNTRTNKRKGLKRSSKKSP